MSATRVLLPKVEELHQDGLVPGGAGEQAVRGVHAQSGAAGGGGGPGGGGGERTRAGHHVRRGQDLLPYITSFSKQYKKLLLIVGEKIECFSISLTESVFIINLSLFICCRIYTDRNHS